MMILRVFEEKSSQFQKKAVGGGTNGFGPHGGLATAWVDASCLK